MQMTKPSSSHRGRWTAATLVLALSALISLGLVSGIGVAAGSSGAAQYQYGHRVTICHLTHSKKHPQVTITVAQAALRAHLRRGDTVGACVASTSTASKHTKSAAHPDSASKSGSTTTDAGAKTSTHGNGGNGNSSGGKQGGGHGH
jgi:hypothetical protein